MTELASRKYADKYALGEKVTFDEKGVGTVTEDFNDALFEEGGLTLDQVKKYQKATAKHVAAATLIGGDKATEFFKENPDTRELVLEYQVGHDRHRAYYDRENTKRPVVNELVSHGYGDKGELKKVHKEIQGMFDNVNT